MRAGEELCEKHIRKPDSSGVLGLACVARYGDFRQRRLRFSNEVEILRRIALPLLRDDLVVTFHQCVARQMPAARREVPHHGLVHDNRGMQVRFDLQFGRLRFLILTHMV